MLQCSISSDVCKVAAIANDFISTVAHKNEHSFFGNLHSMLTVVTRIRPLTGHS